MEKSPVQKPSIFDDSYKKSIDSLTQLLKSHGVPSPVANSVVGLYSEMRTKYCIAYHLLSDFPECQTFFTNDPFLH